MRETEVMRGYSVERAGSNSFDGPGPKRDCKKVGTGARVVRPAGAGVTARAPIAAGFMTAVRVQSLEVSLLRNHLPRLALGQNCQATRLSRIDALGND